MKNNGIKTLCLATGFTLLAGSIQIASAQSKLTLNDFYRPFELSEITPKNMQQWPYYRYTSMNWDEYGLLGTVSISAANTPAKLKLADKHFDLEQKLPSGGNVVESLTSTQTKGFLILNNNTIVAEFYDNGFSQNQTQLLQSSSKTYAGVVTSKLIDEGKIDPKKTVDYYLPDFKGSKIGKAKVQNVLDMTSGLLPANDYHVPGGEAFMFEMEQGLKGGDAIGHRKAIVSAKTQNSPGEVYNYNDKNTDLLAILSEKVSGKPFNKLLSELFQDIGANSAASIALTSDGTVSPSYGISTTLRDYALFHQWIAQGKAPKSFYMSTKELSKDRLAKSEKGKGMKEVLGSTITYASQGWVLADEDLILSIGSYGQIGFSHMETGVSVVFMQDWEDNSVVDKLLKNIEIARQVLAHFKSK